MEKTPGCVRSGRKRLHERVSAHKKDLVEVQTLFYERRYKQCIARCEQLQRPEIHPLIQAFLWYYRAVANESIGLLAHTFSQNKLQFLDVAGESLKLAAKCLPLPYASTKTGLYDHQEESPHTPDFYSCSPFANMVQHDGELTFPPNVSGEGLSQSPLTTSFYSTVSPSKVAPVTNLDNPSPQKDTIREEVIGLSDSDDGEPSTPSQLTNAMTPATHRTRLSRVLSTPQTLQEELVPSPLFSRAVKQAHLLHLSGIDAVVPRPLPPLPFNHNPKFFKLEGTRITQNLSYLRKTAVQTLIARYEGTLPLSPTTTSSHSSPPMTPDISTPRFHMIRDAFSPDPRNSHLETYLSTKPSAALMRYNAHLVEFRTQLANHITYIDAEIARVQNLQAERTTVKMLGPKQRLASFWSFDIAKSPCPRGSRKADQRDTGEVDRDLGKQADDTLDSATRAKKERIEKLRRHGWQVTKEKHGFKGVAFYDSLAKEVEMELRFAEQSVS